MNTNTIYTPREMINKSNGIAMEYPSIVTTDLVGGKGKRFSRNENHLENFTARKITSKKWA